MCGYFRIWSPECAPQHTCLAPGVLARKWLVPLASICLREVSSEDLKAYKLYELGAAGSGPRMDSSLSQMRLGGALPQLGQAALWRSDEQSSDPEGALQWIILEHCRPQGCTVPCSGSWQGDPPEAPEILRLSRFIAEISLRTGSPRQWHRPDATITNGGVIFGAFLVACGTWVGWGAGRRGGGGKGGCSRPKS